MSKILIIGGTGTLGKALTEQLYANNEITILSRDEFKLSQMKKRYPKAKYIIGDIRDKSQIEKAFLGQQTVFQCAALKQVDMGEYFPHQFVMTNYLGTKNCYDLACDNLVENFIFFSTDKAVLPINSYGMSKALAENYVLSQVGFTKTKVYRWGNILGSRGSVLDSWIDAINFGKTIDVTDMRMTRFWINIDVAAKFVIDTYLDDDRDILIPPMKSAKIMDLIVALHDVLGISTDKTPFNVVGIRPGEKIHEVLYSSHEYCMRSDTCTRYTNDELRQMIKEYMSCPKS